MLATNPLQIPEIQLQVAHYLDRTDLVQCVSVCRAWHQVFLPRIWRKLKVGQNRSSFAKLPSRDNLIQHCNLVQELHICDMFPGRYRATYPKLNTLALTKPDPSPWNTLALTVTEATDQDNHANEGCKTEGDPTELIAVNPSLIRLTISKLSEYLLAPFWVAVSELPHLKILNLHDARMEGKENLEAFWTACRNLESLCISGTWLAADDFTFEDDLVFRRLQVLELQLYMDMDKMDQLDMIRRCPYLEELIWCAAKNAHVLELFALDAARGLWPRLERLKLESDVPDAVTALVIDGIPRLSKLDTNDPDLGPIFFQSLGHHSKTIVSLNLGRCGIRASSMLQEMLCSFPHLEEFTSSSIYAKDIVDGQLWVCLSLKVLQVAIIFESAHQDLQPVVFDRLSRLICLETLRIGTSVAGRRFYFGRTLDLRLSSGLGALAKLTNLKHLSANSTTQKLGEEDLRWMVASWRKLESVEGAISGRANGADLVRILKEHHISLLRSQQH
ncbi:hypothetical protein BGX27_006954 [Mortierella sp. AM989]|nr:hypothetical protein BGX27_006954 [Mortierella sp. AM989]